MSEEEFKYAVSCVGWMSPKGDMFPCDTREHMSKAEEICAHNKYVGHLKGQEDDALLTRGWIKISMLSYRERGLAFWAWREPTEPQRDKLRSIYSNAPNAIAKRHADALRRMGIV